MCNFLNQCVSKQVTNRILQIKSKSLKILTLIFAHKIENGAIFAPYMNLQTTLQTLLNWNAPVNGKPQGRGWGASPGHLTVFPFPWVGNNKRFDVTQDPEGG